MSIQLIKKTLIVCYKVRDDWRMSGKTVLHQPKLKENNALTHTMCVTEAY